MLAATDQRLLTLTIRALEHADVIERGSVLACAPTGRELVRARELAANLGHLLFEIRLRAGADRELFDQIICCRFGLTAGEAAVLMGAAARRAAGAAPAGDAS